MILPALKQKKRDIDQVVQTFDAQLEAKKKGLKDMQANYRDANRDYNVAKTLYDERESNYETLRNDQRRTETTIKELGSLKARIDSEDAKNVGRIYFLNQELKRVLEEVEIKTSKRLTSELAKNWVSVETARENLVKKEDVLEKAKTDLESYQRGLDVLEKNRREDILRNI
jgi:chromosome segregation ATPase